MDFFTISARGIPIMVPTQLAARSKVISTWLEASKKSKCDATSLDNDNDEVGPTLLLDFDPMDVYAFLSSVHTCDGRTIRRIGNFLMMDNEDVGKWSWSITRYWMNNIAYMRIQMYSGLVDVSKSLMFVVICPDKFYIGHTAIDKVCADSRTPVRLHGKGLKELWIPDNLKYRFILRDVGGNDLCALMNNVCVSSDDIYDAIDACCVHSGYEGKYEDFVKDRGFSVIHSDMKVPIVGLGMKCGKYNDVLSQLMKKHLLDICCILNVKVSVGDELAEVLGRKK